MCIRDRFCDAAFSVVFFILTEVKAIKELRINDEIRAAEVRLVSDGEENQIMSFKDALNIATDKGMDLVEISPNAKPPVCRVMDYGKYRFEQVKREKEAKKNQRVTQIKEVKFRPNIEDHDFETKIKNAERFLKDGDKVKVTVMFRGREITHQDLGFALCKRTTERLDEIASVEKAPKVEGKNMTLILAPKVAK
jgi:translation initiation factor IF-3